MPGFNQILAEIQTAQGNPALGNPFDHVRRKYIGLLAAKTGRHTIIYASRFLQGGPPGLEQLVPITDEDIQGLMSTVQGRTSDKLDLLLHSPGGSPEAAEGIVSYLRAKFTDIRGCDVNGNQRDQVSSAVVVDEGGPLEVGVQKLTSNQAVLLWSKRSWW